MKNFKIAYFDGDVIFIEGVKIYTEGGNYVIKNDKGLVAYKDKKDFIKCIAPVKD